ncbi:type IV pilus biogenesis/stability protein PilW [Alteromonas aestuariivivens]|uniref:type IV pilus biogenesis/stability protein PilW n=1 Tax=Alteromonas aestuariivivens TaxID=1938339 RepID=UPI0015F288CF|nr:type IV pilus biogenesis/stability protein PilW [Alteromonas aestuariivivens]
MRLGIIACALLIAGCVSQPQPGSFSSDGFDQQEAARTRISLGLTYLKNGNYTQAKVNLDKALEFAPRMADSHYSLAYYYQLVGEHVRAEEAYQNALKLEPSNPDIANSYGAFLCQQGRYSDAKNYFLKAVNNQQYANSAETYENMALCAQGQGQLDDAIEYFKSALNHQPMRAKSLYLLTDLYATTEQWELAAQTLKRYERAGRVSPDSLRLAILIAQGQGNWEMARNYGQMLTTMYPTSVQAAAYREALSTQPEPKAVRKSKSAVVTQVPSRQVSQQASQLASEAATLVKPAAESAADEALILAGQEPAEPEAAPEALTPASGTGEVSESVQSEQPGASVEPEPFTELAQANPELDSQAAEPAVDSGIAGEAEGEALTEVNSATDDAVEATTSDAQSVSVLPASEDPEQAELTTAEDAEPQPEEAAELVVDTADLPVPAEANEEEREAVLPDMNRPQIAERPRFHIVQLKENLYRISVKYNVKISTLQQWNELKDPSDIEVGMKLWLVPQEQQNN